MATVFKYPLLENRSYIPTSSVSSLQASTDKDCVDVTLSCENGLNGDIEEFFSARLYAFNNTVELTDFGSLIEEYFRKQDKVADTVTVKFDNASIDAHFLYCEWIQPTSFDPFSCLFVASHVQRVHQDSIISMAAVDRGAATPFVIKAAGHRASDDALVVVSKSEFRSFNQAATIYFHVYDILRWALNMTDAEVGEDLRDVLYFSIEYGGIQKMCYIVPAPAYLTLSFRNIFNVQEFLDVVGILTSKTEVDRDTAVCSGISRHYNRSVSRSYSLQSEPLTQDELASFEQLIASHHVSLRIDDDDFDILITDHTCEPSSDNESLTSVKFSWQFSDRRPRMFDTAFNGILPQRRRVFDDTFSLAYE